MKHYLDIPVTLEQEGREEAKGLPDDILRLGAGEENGDGNGVNLHQKLL